MKLPKELSLQFGVGSPTVQSQLRKQKFRFDKEEIRNIQSCFDAVTFLSLNQFITEAQAYKISMKIYESLRRKVS